MNFLHKFSNRFFAKIVKLYKWNKFLWNDFDWDYSYLLRVIQFKLQMMEPSIRNGYALNSNETADEIKVAINLLEKLINEDFNNNWDKLEEKYGKFSILDGSFERDLVNNANRVQYEIDTKEAFRLDALEKKKIENAFFKQMRKYNGWWD